MAKVVYSMDLILDVRFRFKGYDWLVTDVNGKTYMLEHFTNKRTKPFKEIHWKYNNGSECLWHDKHFISKKELRKKSYKVGEKVLAVKGVELNRF